MKWLHRKPLSVYLMPAPSSLLVWNTPGWTGPTKLHTELFPVAKVPQGVWRQAVPTELQHGAGVAVWELDKSTNYRTAYCWWMRFFTTQSALSMLNSWYLYRTTVSCKCWVPLWKLGCSLTHPQWYFSERVADNVHYFLINLLLLLKHFLFFNFWNLTNTAYMKLLDVLWPIGKQDQLAGRNPCPQTS